MDNNKKENREENKETGQHEGTFAKNSNTRAQAVDNEQTPHDEDLSQRENRPPESTGNLSDQYHPATKSGEIQNKKNLENTKAAQQGDDYYDQGAPQPSASDIKEVDDEAVDKVDDDR